MNYDSDENCKLILYSSNATGIPQLYTIPTDLTSNAKQITKGKEPVLMATISPKADKIVYYQDKDGNEIFQLFLLPVEGGEGKLVTKTPYRTLGVGWHPNGKEVTRSFASMKGAGLETVNLETEESFVLKEPTPPIMDVKYSHDGKWIACTNMKTMTNTEVTIFNRDDPSDSITYSISDKSRDGLPSWSPDDKKIALMSEATGWGRAVIQEFQGDERIVLNLEEAEGVPADYAVWNAKGDIVYYIVSKHSRSTIYSHPIEGEKGPSLPFPEGTLQYLKISKDGKKIIALHSSMRSPPGIYLHEIGSQSVNPLTPRDFNVDINLLETPQSIWYKSFDGKDIHAWYMPAVGEKKNSPAVIFAHGGPWGQVNDGWFDGAFMQPLSQSGFAALGPNFRGSTGYGSEFQNIDIGDPGGGDLEDVVHGVEWLKKQSEIDGSKIGIMGGSYGGYMTLMALTKKPDVFVVGVSLVPVVDWLEMYDLSDFYFKLFEQTLLGGTPRKKKDLYIDRSPITHVSNIKAPVMIMAGKADSRCPIQPIEKFVAKLKEMNHPHEFVLEEKAGHISALLNWDESVPTLTKMMEYLKKHLM